MVEMVVLELPFIQLGVRLLEQDKIQAELIIMLVALAAVEMVVLLIALLV